MRIAMWSGPRNLSTAMMYAFAQRADCEAVDEPFYAAYLAETGLDHPMRAEILDSQPNDRGEVVAALAEAPKGIRYEKHMTHHMLPGWDLGWLADVVNVFLIRHPARVIASYAAKRENPTLNDIGFRQQFELFEHVKSLGQTPVVIDSADVRADPEQSLTRLCSALGLEFDPAMLRWEAGPKPYDGAWAPHWYGAVWNSTGFASVEGPLPDLSSASAALVEQALPYYEPLAALKL
ncbi:Branched-chain-amino-acid aminotransferase-like protein 2 [Candidatus Rhodobacter oscarellae]|uniref:Branched-chain-amino-acid aminotransferase-like protein 2 n=1 Tax=Candidatus Rhodobacter oscarellae TaxID=1675527 RepID=A0A0J9GZI6_9RHOB|nr:hypothetical protein [Candidatus Rhodobacter lobularis]KMW58888.1 Branched-chain-amino-acid aminotransferase-like protein 2 [Candidatus Rhodobacter lobularis]